jgi:uncharacterized protein (DUF2236 family)
VKVTELPELTDWLAGCVVKAGPLFTVRTAALLVAELTELVATTVYEAASLEATLAIVYEELVAPEMADAPFFH